ncbi:hypothetical protein STIAU_2608 [Stigmatella aurantiaca DW4/3-1]|nr:hypothetical protein STIAU_2608 [Stigmatella aurantiaca DW4/3-1]
MRRSHPEVLPAIMESLDIYRRAIEPHTLAWSPDGEGAWQEIDGAGWERIHKKMLHPRGANIWLRDTPHLTTDYEFRYYGRELTPPLLDDKTGMICAVAFWLPTGYLEAQGPEQVRNLALKLGSALPFNSGHAGLSFYCHESLLGITEPLRLLSLRYPGVDMPAMESIPMELGAKIKGAYWLTFLGAPILERLGGTAGLRSRLHSEDTRVEDLSKSRAVVRLGEWPESGDLEHDDTLPSYRELAQVLAPWLYHAPRSPWSGFSDEDVLQWESRFLRG